MRAAGWRAGVWVCPSGRTKAAQLTASSRELLLAGLRSYQARLSPFMPYVCKFHPCSSRYPCQASELHGARQTAFGLPSARSQVGMPRP